MKTVGRTLGDRFLPGYDGACAETECAKWCAHDRKANHSMLKLEESLKRLKTDYLDLWQIHQVVWDDDHD